MPVPNAELRIENQHGSSGLITLLSDSYAADEENGVCRAVEINVAHDVSEVVAPAFAGVYRIQSRLLVDPCSKLSITASATMHLSIKAEGHQKLAVATKDTNGNALPGVFIVAFNDEGDVSLPAETDGNGIAIVEVLNTNNARLGLFRKQKTLRFLKLVLHYDRVLKGVPITQAALISGQMDLTLDVNLPHEH